MEATSITAGIVSEHACIRAHKLALPFADLGHKILLASNNLAGNTHPWWAYNMAAMLYKGEAKSSQLQFQDTIRMLDPIVDVWHVHNEPDWPVILIKELSKKPIVYDVHDMRSQRAGHVEEMEEKAFAAADGVSVVSRRYQQIVQERYPGKPCVEVLSAIPKAWMPTEKLPFWRSGIVYAGGLGSPGINEFSCRDWSEVFKEISLQGIQTWAYVGNPNVDRKHYPRTVIMGPLEYVSLLRELTQYGVAIIGSPRPDPMFDGALPNKLFEYIAAGLPMVCMNAPDVSNFLAATGMGVTVNSAEEIPAAIERIYEEEMHETVWRNRIWWTADRQMHTLCQLYETVLGRPIKRPLLVPAERKVPQAGLPYEDMMVIE